MFIETSRATTLAPAERHIEDQLEDCRLKIIRLNTLLIFNLQSFNRIKYVVPLEF